MRRTSVTTALESQRMTLQKILEDGKTSHAHELDNKYSENGYWTKNNLQSQRNHHQNSYVPFHRNRKNNLKMYMSAQSILSC